MVPVAAAPGEFLKLHGSGHYPGLGCVKKLSLLGLKGAMGCPTNWFGDPGRAETDPERP